MPPFAPRYFQNSTADSEKYWPLRTARLATVLISVLTVWLCYLAGTEATGNPATGLLVASLVAFLPQFTFRGMNVSNDAAVTALSACALDLIIRIVRRGFSWGVGGLAALAIAGAFLSKAIAVFLPVPLALALLSERAPWRDRVIRVAALSGIMLALVAPWVVRNLRLHGDPLAAHAMLTAVGDIVHVKPLSSPYFLIVFPKLLAASFVGVFGWMNLFLPMWTYILYGLLFASLGGCWMTGTLQRRLDLRLSLILASVPVLNLIVVVYINLILHSLRAATCFPHCLRWRCSWDLVCARSVIGRSISRRHSSVRWPL